MTAQYNGSISFKHQNTVLRPLSHFLCKSDVQHLKYCLWSLLSAVNHSEQYEKGYERERERKVPRTHTKSPSVSCGL